MAVVLGDCRNRATAVVGSAAMMLQMSSTTSMKSAVGVWLADDIAQSKTGAPISIHDDTQEALR
jgi:hypothetical protein